MANTKKRFVVTLTMLYNATVEVEANNANEATDYVHNNLDTLAPDSIFNKGEKIVDFAELINSEINYTLPNNTQIELLSEMHTANYDFGDFDEPIGDLRKTYYEVTDEAEKNAIEQKIDAQCTAFADFLGIQYPEIQGLISYGDLSYEIKQALIN